ncbi:alpha/beta-hydrolase [Cerioporus squamosus]|nr:alpha/beta-hydrolase [Cerioporus squamosus]
MHARALLLPVLTLALGFVPTVVLGQGNSGVPNTFPHAWPGQPKGNFSTEWQSYFEVTEKLPNITGALPRNFAGNIPVNRAGHPNDTLFFWAWEKVGQNGSLTAPASPNNTDPWIIWLQGGPGSSGMIALTTENGPIHIQPNGTWFHNNFSWNALADTIWIDQPVGTGFSTADSTGYVPDEDQTGEDFVGFLSNLVQVFPSLATRPLFLTGESYAGTYIPYITKHIFQHPNPPVKLRKIAIGDGSLGSQATVEHLPVVNVIETYPALIGFDHDVFNYFREQTHLCGFDLNLTYPQNGHFPTLNLVQPTEDSALSQSLSNPTETRARSLQQTLAEKFTAVHGKPDLTKRADFHERREEQRQQWKRDLSGRANGTIDPFYGCFLLDELIDYAVNFTFPWSNGEFDVYDIPDGTNPEPFKNASDFFNDNRTRAALHAPTSKDWIRNFNYPSAPCTTAPRGTTPRHGGDHPEHDVRGVQGFSRKPSTPWFDDDGAFAGIVHQERNLTYVLFDGAGHLVPLWKPAQALVFLREFVLGSNLNGTVSGTVVVGGENSTLANDFLPGGNVVYFGSSATQGTSTIPAATQAAWNSFIATATATSSPLGPNAAYGRSIPGLTGVLGLFLGSLMAFRAI